MVKSCSRDIELRVKVKVKLKSIGICVGVTSSIT